MRFLLVVVMIFFGGCSLKSPSKIENYDVAFKTKNLKFNDKGFVSKFDDYFQLQIYNAGFVAIELKIYKDKVCKGLFACQDSKQFNLEQFGSGYKDDFLFDLLSKMDDTGINFKDNGTIIKISKEEL